MLKRFDTLIAKEILCLYFFFFVVSVFNMFKSTVVYETSNFEILSRT